MRYNRLAEDLGLGEDLVMENLVFADAKIGDTMEVAMRPADAVNWLGKEPPNLSLIARSRGADWLYTYFLTFYQDETGGWNNLALPERVHAACFVAVAGYPEARLRDARRSSSRSIIWNWRSPVCNPRRNMKKRFATW